jgi:hypothetical protein
MRTRCCHLLVLMWTLWCLLREDWSILSGDLYLIWCLLHTIMCSSPIRVSARKKIWCGVYPPIFLRGVWPPLQKHFLHLTTLNYAPKYLYIPSQVVEIVIFNKGLFQNLGTYLYPRIFWVRFPFYPSGRNPAHNRSILHNQNRAVIVWF